MAKDLAHDKQRLIESYANAPRFSSLKTKEEGYDPRVLRSPNIINLGPYRQTDPTAGWLFE